MTTKYCVILSVTALQITYVRAESTLNQGRVYCRLELNNVVFLHVSLVGLLSVVCKSENYAYVGLATTYLCVFLFYCYMQQSSVVQKLYISVTLIKPNILQKTEQNSM